MEFRAGIRHFLSVLFLFASDFLLQGNCDLQVGINYGQVANNLPPPKKVVPLLQSIGVKKVKLYDADAQVLQAFANTGVEFIVGLPNECLSKMRDHLHALAWIKSNVQCYLPATKITTIAVGNEVLTSNDTSLVSSLLPAMVSMHSALETLGLQKQVRINTAHSLAILGTSYPPSAGRFRADLQGCVSQIAKFLQKFGSPFLINAYPYFAYKAESKHVSLDYVLFESTSGVVDPVSNLKYDNMLFSQIDAVYSALALVGCEKLSVQISETGWPSRGDADEPGATVDNAKKYNGNLMKMMKKTTPMKPNIALDVYIFALFNENMKPGPTSERNYGLFKPDGTPAYELGLSSVTGSDGASRGVDSGGDRNATPPPPADSAATPTSNGKSTGFLSISSAPEMLHGGGMALYYYGMQGLLLWSCRFALGF